MENLFKPGSFVRAKHTSTNPALDLAIVIGDYDNGYKKSKVLQRTDVPGQRIIAQSETLELVDVAGLNGPAYHEFFKRVMPIAWYGGLYNGGKSGTDPEVFAFDSHGEVVPAWKFLASKSENQYVYWDGVQAELTTEPKGCHEYLTDGVKAKLGMIWQALSAYNPTANLRAQDVVELDDKTLQLEDDKYIMLGCSPSRNIYDDIQPIEIDDPRAHKYRYSGTHLHYSDVTAGLPDWWPNGVVAMMDKIGGIMLTAMGRDVENPLRRKAYGRPGEFRTPGDGEGRRLEYRTPGAFLLQHPAIFHFGADMCRMGYRLGQIFDGRREDVLPNAGYKEIIMGCDADGALKYIKDNKDVFEKVLAHSNPTPYTQSTQAKTWKALKVGIKKFGVYDNPLQTNWNLDGLKKPHPQGLPDNKWGMFCQAWL